jgi:hypothetical protein
MDCAISKFSAKSNTEANSWVVALRIAVAASRHSVLKRSVTLAEVTSIQSPRDDVVFGQDWIVIVIGDNESEEGGEHIWLTHLTDFDHTFEVLTNAWLEQSVSTM